MTELSSLLWRSSLPRLPRKGLSCSVKAKRHLYTHTDTHTQQTHTQQLKEDSLYFSRKRPLSEVSSPHCWGCSVLTGHLGDPASSHPVTLSSVGYCPWLHGQSWVLTTSTLQPGKEEEKKWKASNFPSSRKQRWCTYPLIYILGRIPNHGAAFSCKEAWEI